MTISNRVKKSVDCRLESPHTHQIQIYKIDAKLDANEVTWGVTDDWGKKGIDKSPSPKTEVV